MHSGCSSLLGAVKIIDSNNTWQRTKNRIRMTAKSKIEGFGSIWMQASRDYRIMLTLLSLQRN